jgi:hypothetical protein
VADIRKLSLAHQTMFADLVARCMDASFDEQFPPNGTFQKIGVKGRFYWYYSGYKTRSAANGAPQRSRMYVGPADDPAIESLVARFSMIKADYLERRSMVQSLVAAGLPSPVGLVGDITEALARSGFFRMRGVLIGTLAFQTYAGFLGVRMQGAALMTGDADFAQFHSVSHAIDDSMPPILDVLSSVDPTFRPIPHMANPKAATRFRNRSGFDVEFLTPNRGSEDHQGVPASMPALGGAGAEPLRYLDYLIHAPARSVLLHKAGVAVSVPTPERFAVHKMIVSSFRRNDDNGRQKSRKDLLQTSLLLQALEIERRIEDVGFAWIEAWGRGPAWQSALSTASGHLPPDDAHRLIRAISEACAKTGMPHAGPTSSPAAQPELLSPGPRRVGEPLPND